MSLQTLRMRRMRWFIVLPLLGLMIGLFFVARSNHQRQLSELRAEEARLTRDISLLSAEESRLRVQIEQVDSNGALDAAARAEAFVKPGELRFVIDNEDGQLEKYTAEEWDILMNENAMDPH